MMFELQTVLLIIEWVVKQCEQGHNLEKIKLDFITNYIIYKK